MNTFFLIVLIGISLSMDAFSLSLMYGTIGICNKDKLLLAVVVGLFHFFMPLLGFFIGEIVSDSISQSMELITLVIFCIIGFSMIFSDNRDVKDKFVISFVSFFLFGLSVSIDSLTVGFGISGFGLGLFVSPIVFSMSSFLFTLLGLYIGDYLNYKFGRYSTIFGGSLLILLGIVNYF